MMPYIWDYRGRVLIALACLVISKLAMVGVPVVLKYIVDTLNADPGQLVTLPILLLVVYGLLRFINSGFNELRDAIFARVRFHAMNSLSVSVLDHLHHLSLRYHHATWNAARKVSARSSITWCSISCPPRPNFCWWR
jgi:ATP-binding cassette subfamily B protein